MNLTLWLQNLAAYSFQIAFLVAAGMALPAVFRLRMPRVNLAYWQLLLAICLLLPLVQPWKPLFPSGGTVLLETTEMIIPGGSALPPVTGIRSSLATLYPMIAAVLLAGVLLRMTRLGIGLLRLRYLRRHASRLPQLPAAVADMQSCVGVRPRILVSSKIDSPVTFGALMPVILFPSGFIELDERFQRGIACHELLHVRRRDWLLTLAEEIIRALFWFHPAIWWLIAKIQLSREQVVDHHVVQMTGARRPYIESLLSIAETKGRAQVLPAPLFLRERQLTRRVALMLKEASMSKRRLAVSLSVMFALLLLTGRLAVWSFPLKAAAPGMVEPVNVGTGQNPLIAATSKDPEQTAAQSSRVEVGTLTSVASSPRIVRGYVYDMRGGTIPDARVQIVQKDTGEVLDQVRTDRDGSFELKLPPQQDASLRIQQAGFMTAVYSGPFPEAGALKFTLKLGQISETVGVGAATAARRPASLPPQASSDSVEVTIVSQEPRKLPIRIGGNIQASKLINKVQPVYPAEAKQAGVSGAVVMQLTITEKGDVSDIKVVSGHPLLRDAAVNAVKQWQYSPTLLNGEPAPVIATVTVQFELDEQNILRLTMDEVGNLWEETNRLEGKDLSARIAATQGPIRVTANLKVPPKIVEETLQAIQRLADGRELRLSSPYAFRDGHYVCCDNRYQAELKKPIAVSGAAQAAKLVSRVEPIYPRKAKEARVEGTVVVEITVNETGEVSEIETVSGPDLLREAAVEAVRQWRYTPTLLNGEPAIVKATVTIQFVLR